ncbi:toxin glutamine deamidase domain-containing protein [Phytohabitans aurantiacus]|uniref:Tox-PL domain-containing protein n=1 Tax=Phytohabitans aurantiacus TaxID=3016789 RepID=A0ABQ5R0X0_9ACTN|nr:toxin glutamine deamidase domain-containing protein [Phytohabitans aurantiacus]GLI00055.1 hypothetical protein Pa4123_53310 [Phytohabitans aurantiacus]
MAESQDILLEIREFFQSLDEWIPGAGSFFVESVLMFPEARHDRLFDLADAYQTAAEMYADHLEEIRPYLTDLQAWQGDGGAQVTHAQLQAYFDEVSSMSEAISALQQGVHGKALEIEMAVYMAIVNLIMVGIALVQLLLTFWTGIGAISGAGAMATGRWAIIQVMKKLLQRMWEQTIKAGIRRTIDAGIKGAAKTALKSGLMYAGFMGVTKGGITLIQAAEGHDPFTENWGNKFARELFDGFIAGALGGPLQMGIQNRLAGGLAFMGGQFGSNAIQLGRDRLIDLMGGTEWAQRNGLYSGMTWDGMKHGMTPAALFGAMITDFGGYGRGALKADIAAWRGDANLFGGAHGLDGAGLPGALPDGARAEAPSGAHAEGTGTGTQTLAPPSHLTEGAPQQQGGQQGGTGNRGGTSTTGSGSTSGTGSTGRDGGTSGSGSSRDTSSSRDSGSTQSTPDGSRADSSTRTEDGSSARDDSATRTDDGSSSRDDSATRTEDGGPPREPVRAEPTPEAPRGETATPDGPRAETGTPDGARTETATPDQGRADTASPDGTRAETRAPDQVRADAPPPDAVRGEPVRADPTALDPARTDAGTPHSTADAGGTRADAGTPHSTADAGGPRTDAAAPHSTADAGGARADSGSTPDSSRTTHDGSSPDGGPLVDGRPPADGTSPVDSPRATDGTRGPDSLAHDGGPARDGDGTGPATREDATVGARDGGDPPGGDPVATAPPDTGRADTGRADGARADGGRADAGRADAGRSESRWSEWRQRLEARAEQQFGRAVGENFGGRPAGRGGEAGPGRLTPEMVQRALDTPPERLNAYGNRLRDFVEQHFTHVDETTGTRRPMDGEAIDARLRELRGDTPAGTPRDSTPDEAREDGPQRTEDGGDRGDTGRLPEDAGRQPDGGVPVRVPGDGPAPAHPEGRPDGTPTGRGDERAVPTRADGDPEAASPRPDVAGPRDLGVLDQPTRADDGTARDTAARDDAPTQDGRAREDAPPREDGTTREDAPAREDGARRDDGAGRDDAPARDDGTVRDDGTARDDGPARDDSARREDGARRDDGAARDDGTARDDGPARDDGARREDGARDDGARREDGAREDGARREDSAARDDALVPDRGGRADEPGAVAPVRDAGPGRTDPGDTPRNKLIDRVKARIHDLFGRQEQLNREQALRDQAVRDQYHEEMRQARERIAQAIEGDPRLRQARYETQQHRWAEQHARAEVNAKQAEAQIARADEAHSRQRAQQLRDWANRLDPANPQRNGLIHQADQSIAHANQRAVDAQRADVEAQQAHQRAEDARTKATESTNAADKITRDLYGENKQAWKWANQRLEQGYSLVGRDHRGPEVSALTGRGDPPPVWANRPYGENGGLRHPLAVDQARLENALRDPSGGYQRAADPKGPWLKLVNAFGFHADPTRTQNCLDTVAALFDTFVHGRPTVAAPRTFDGYSNGNAHLPFAGEHGGPGRMEDLTGGRYQSVVNNVAGQHPTQALPRVDAGFDAISQQLLAGGHGSFASIITGWRGGGSHAWAAVNFQGTVHFIDPQAGTVVTAVDTPHGTQFVDADTGQVVQNPIHSRNQITAMDALVVDGNARPMPFADRPAGTWNDRPLTREYLAHQPPDVRATQGAHAEHGTARAEADQARQQTDLANKARTEAQQHANDAQAARTQSQDAANRAATHRADRDAAWNEGARRDQVAQQHDAAARQWAESQGRGTPEQARHAEQMERHHREQAQQARQEANAHRVRAHEHDGLRQQAELQQQRATESASNFENRRNYAEQAARQHDQTAQAHEQRAQQAEAQYRQHADQAANAHDQQAAQAKAEAAQHRQQAAQHPPNDPVRQLEEGRAQHQERMAEAAEKAANQYRGAEHYQRSAEAHDQRANQHSQAAESSRQHAARDTQAAHAAEQRRLAAAERARQMDPIDPQVAQQHRAEAAQHAQARDDAMARAAQHRQDAQTAEQTAATERAEAAKDRVTRDQFHDAAEAWHSQLRNERLFDPGAPGAGREPFNRDNLPDNLRDRYDALQDPRAREQFERLYDKAGERLETALDNMERKAVQDGRTLEDSLIDKHDAETAKQAAKDAIQPPPPDVLHEIETQLRGADDVRSRIEEYARTHPEVRGTEGWLGDVRNEVSPLRAEQQGKGDPSVQLARDHGNNIRGIEGEVILAERSHGVVEVSKDISAVGPDGKLHKTDVDVVAEGGRVWRDAKNYNPFGPGSKNIGKFTRQIETQLRALVFDTAHHVDGQPPRLEWHFTRGVDPAVAAILEGIRIKDPVTGAELPHRVHVIDGTRPVEAPPPPDGPRPPDGGPTPPPRPEAPEGASHADPPAGPPHAEPPGGHPETPAGAVRSDLPRAMAEVRPYFPHDWVQVSGETLRISSPDGGTITIRLEVGPVTDGWSTSRFDSQAGEHVIRISETIGREDLVRALVDQVTTVATAEVGGRPNAGGLRQLDVLATEQARVQHQLNHATDATPAQREAWAREDARLTREFRTHAELLGILDPEHRTGLDPDTQARRDEVWADLSDGARAIVATMADPHSVLGASSKARSFLPLSEEFRTPYEAIDNFSYYAETHLPPELRQRFQEELLPQIREFQKEALEQFKATYKEFFPSTSAERALPPARDAAARAEVQPLVDRTEAMLGEIHDWAQRTGVEELRDAGFDRAVELGEQAWRARYEEYRTAINEVIARFDYMGEPLGYIGSMQDGMRGPHKAMAHADLREFDVDLYVIHQAEFDRLYDSVMENAPNQISRGKIFPDNDRPDVAPDLLLLGREIVDQLELLFPDNPGIADSMVVLRREPPY